jgi:1-acyl-sn-glycerol-3-phosphate acyltransferase
MFGELRGYDPGQGLGQLLFFRLVLNAARAALTLFYKLRVYHAERVPREGGLLVVSNHQSHLDPPIVGVSLRGRHIVPIARVGLFKNRFLGWLITNLNAIAINQKEADAAAIRRTVKEIAAGRAVLIFPEGYRSPDGTIRPFKRGTWLLISRAKCRVLPAAVEGAFDAWPRDREFPSLWNKRVAVAFGEPVAPERLLAMGPEEGLAFLAREIDGLRLELRERLRWSSGGVYPAAGPGDRLGHGEVPGKIPDES